MQWVETFVRTFKYWSGSDEAAVCGEVVRTALCLISAAPVLVPVPVLVVVVVVPAAAAADSAPAPALAVNKSSKNAKDETPRVRSIDTSLETVAAAVAGASAFRL